jgi:hypothetical protein
MNFDLERNHSSENYQPVLLPPRRGEGRDLFKVDVSLKIFLSTDNLNNYYNRLIYGVCMSGPITNNISWLIAVVIA